MKMGIAKFWHQIRSSLKGQGGEGSPVLAVGKSRGEGKFCKWQERAEASCLSLFTLKALSDSNHFLNQMVEIFREIRGKAFRPKDSQDFQSQNGSVPHPVKSLGIAPIWEGGRPFLDSL